MDSEVETKSVTGTGTGTESTQESSKLRSKVVSKVVERAEAEEPGPGPWGALGTTATTTATTTAGTSSGGSESLSAWFAQLWRLSLDRMGAGVAGGAAVTFPPVLHIFAALLRSRELAPLSSAYTTAASLTPITVPIRSWVFAGTDIPSRLILQLVNKWEKRLESRGVYKHARRLVLSPEQAHTYSLQAFLLLNAQQLEVYILDHEDEKDAVKESMKQVKWLQALGLPEAPSKLYACQRVSAFPLKEMGKSRGLVVSLASCVSLPIPPACLAPSDPLPFVDYDEPRPHKPQPSPYLSLRQETGDGIQGMALEGFPDWAMWELPCLYESQLCLYLIASSGVPRQEDYAALVRGLDFETVRGAVESLMARRTPAGQGLEVDEVRLPQARAWPEHPLRLKAALEKGMPGLFSETADLGELSPGGRLQDWLCLDVLEWPEPAGPVRPPASRALVVRATPFLLLWDAGDHLPVALARLASQASQAAHSHTSGSSSAEVATPQSHLSSPPTKRSRCLLQ